MSSPDEVAALVFGKLSLSYGHRFLSLYEGFEQPGPDPWVAVKADWAQELQGVPEQRILWALQNLPEQPPDAPKFRAYCWRAPAPTPAGPALPDAPKKPIDPRFRAALERLAEPSEDKRPLKVQAAARFVSMWGTPGVRLSPMKKQWLDYSREVLAQYERELEREREPAGSH